MEKEEPTVAGGQGGGGLPKEAIGRLSGTARPCGKFKNLFGGSRLKELEELSKAILDSTEVLCKALSMACDRIGEFTKQYENMKKGIGGGKRTDER